MNNFYRVKWKSTHLLCTLNGPFIYPHFCVCIFIRGAVYVSVWLQVDRCVHPCVIPEELSTLISETWYFIDLGITEKLGWLAHKPWGSTCHYLPSTGIINMQDCSQVFKMWVLSLTLARQAFCQMSYISSPYLSTF